MNICKALEEYNKYLDFENTTPYCKILNNDCKWKSLEPSPIANLIKSRFGLFYSGKLTIYELNNMKKQIEEREKSLNDYHDKFKLRIIELGKIIKEQNNLCGEECYKKLQKHLGECTGLNGEYKCAKNFISFHCRFKENGRCKHYYDIERARDELEEIEHNEHEDKQKILDLQNEYERALALTLKEGGD